jgi:hypothetical protein
MEFYPIAWSTPAKAGTLLIVLQGIKVAAVEAIMIGPQFIGTGQSGVALANR